MSGSGITWACISLQTDNHASTPPLGFYRPYALPATQPTASKHRRQSSHYALVDQSEIQVLELSGWDKGATKLEMDETERVVESEVCERLVAAAGTDERRDEDIDRSIRSMAAGATFIWSRSTIILQQ